MTFHVSHIGIDQIPRGFVEITTTQNTFKLGGNQTIGEIQVTIVSTIISGVLDGPNALLAILVLLLRTEIVVQVAF